MTTLTSAADPGREVLALSRRGTGAIRPARPRSSPPEAILVGMLGIHIGVADHWQQAAVEDWAIHAADVSRGGTVST